MLWGELQADKYPDELDGGIRKLADNPENGMKRDHVRDGYRVLFVGSHAVYYTVMPEAAALMGTTMAAFVRAAAKEKARALLEQERRILLSPRDISALAAALDNAFEPNKALRAAIKRARETVRRA